MMVLFRINKSADVWMSYFYVLQKSETTMSFIVLNIKELKDSSVLLTLCFLPFFVEIFTEIM